MKIKAEFAHSKNDSNVWVRDTATLKDLNRGTENQAEILTGLETKINDLGADNKLNNDERLYRLVRWIVSYENPILDKSASKEDKQRAKTQTEEAQRLLNNLVNKGVMLPLTTQEKRLLKDRSNETLGAFADNLLTSGENKKTIGELARSVFTWKNVTIENEKVSVLFVDVAALTALEERAEKDRKNNKDRKKRNERLQVNWLSVAAQREIIAGDAEKAQEFIDKLARYAKREDGQEGNAKALNQAARNVLTLGTMLEQLRLKKQMRKEPVTNEAGEIVDFKEVVDAPNAILAAIDSKRLALSNSAYNDRTKGDPRRSSKGVIIFFACIAILALVLGLGVFVASHGGAALLLAPAGHLLLSVLGVTTKVAADALAFGLLAAVPLALLAIATEITFPAGSLRRFFGYVFKNKAANKKIKWVSPFYKAEHKEEEGQRLLDDETAQTKTKTETVYERTSYWVALKKRPPVTLLKTLFYPLTYLAGVFLAAVSSVSSKSDKADDANINPEKIEHKQPVNLLQSVSEYIEANPAKKPNRRYAELVSYIKYIQLRASLDDDAKRALIQTRAMEIVNNDAQKVDVEDEKCIKHPGSKFSHLLAEIGVAKLEKADNASTHKGRGYALFFKEGFKPNALIAIKPASKKPASSSTL